MGRSLLVVLCVIGVGCLSIGPGADIKIPTQLQPNVTVPVKGLNPKTILVAVITAPDHFKARQAIRSTLKATIEHHLPQHISRGITLKFFIGIPTNPEAEHTELKIEQESAQNDDIVRLPALRESYLNLTLKTISVIEWAHGNAYSHVVKMDDDTFFRIDNFVSFFKAESHPELIYAGTFVWEAPVIDNPSSKWYNFDLYPFEVYPSYSQGPLYFLGSSVIEYIISKRASLTMYRVEDAAVGIWTENMPLIDRVHVSSLIYSTACEDDQTVVFVNPVDPDEMKILQQNVNNSNMCQNNFVPSVCARQQCLCHPVTEECSSLSDSWSEFSNSAYVDLIPRLIQEKASIKHTGGARPRQPLNIQSLE